MNPEGLLLGGVRLAHGSLPRSWIEFVAASAAVQDVRIECPGSFSELLVEDVVYDDVEESSADEDVAADKESDRGRAAETITWWTEGNVQEHNQHW